MENVIVGPELLLLLFGVALVAGCLDTLVGGGGLIVLPALVLAGIPPLHALGTNKLQGTVGTATASFMMLKHGKVRWAEVRPLMLISFAGAALGSGLVQIVDTAFLRFMIPLVLVLVATYFLLSGTLFKQLQPTCIDAKLYRSTVVPGIGFYDGMFGPGTGSFFALAGVALQARPLLDATAVAKTLNFSTNFASLLVFVVVGNFVWQAALAMMLGQAMGAWAGSHILFRINPLYLRVLIVLMCLAMLVRYLLG